MIVPMKKVLLLTLPDAQADTLAALRRLGVMEVAAETVADSADRQELAALLARVDRIIGILASRKAAKNVPPEADGEAVFQAAEQAQTEFESCAKALLQYGKAAEALRDWGHFAPEKIAEFADKGVKIFLCECSAEQFAALERRLEEGVALPVVARNSGMVKFAAVAMADAAPDPLTLPLAELPEQSLAEVEAGQERLAGERARLEKQLDGFAAHLALLRQYRSRLANTAEFLLARDSLAEYGEVAVLKGYVPAPETEKLRQQAAQDGWGLVLSDPEPGEAVPVLLAPPRWAKPILPLLKFLEISPSYQEFDLSIPMLIFFSIFFSMIINDAGYGLLMLGASVVAAIALRKREKARLACRLFLLLSCSSVLWGVLNGSYFGVTRSPLAFFAAGPEQTAHLELVCFVLALVHLSLGRCWRLVNVSSVREALGQLGWLPILFLDFMVVYHLLVAPGAIPTWSFYPAGLGLLLVLYGDIDWHNAGAICNFPSELVGSFTDTLSYVRLFAVGMSGTYMAMSFNDMAMTVWHTSPWCIPVAILIMLLGHALNAALAFMGVLVHGVRLNTLEFSNHANIRWGGRPYRPLEEFRP